MSVPKTEAMSDARTSALVAMSLLRAGYNTAGARLFKELSTQFQPTIDRLAESLRIPPDVRLSVSPSTVREHRRPERGLRDLLR